MNLLENFRESLRAISGNLLRTVLTALIIAIGITALVGILTAIDGLQRTISSSLSELGSQSFQIETKNTRRRGPAQPDRVYPDISYEEADRYKTTYPLLAQISLSTVVTGAAQLKYMTRTTNPNVRVIGADEHFLVAEGLALGSGRAFSPTELDYGVAVCIVGPEIGESLFPNQDPLGKQIRVLGTRCRIVGVLEKKGGSLGGNSQDRAVLLPLRTANQVASGRELTYQIKTIVPSVLEIDYQISEATGLMRRIRGDRPGQPESFQIGRSESLLNTINQTTQQLRMGGFGIGIITLVGAAIGLMNIMLVSVTERTREIGVRKALGATPRRIRQQFLIEAIVICLLGGLAGVIFGLGIGNLVATMVGEGGQFVVPWLWIGVAFVLCVLVGLASGYYPAYKAAQLDPIESLRFE